MFEKIKNMAEITGYFFETKAEDDEEHPDNSQFASHDRRLLDEHVHDLVRTTCVSEVEYLQGILPEDPNPEHVIIFPNTASDASRLL